VRPPPAPDPDEALLLDALAAAGVTVRRVHGTTPKSNLVLAPTADDLLYARVDVPRDSAGNPC
jgi:hypothetical protein